MYEDLIINPLTHEESLINTISYIEQRIEELRTSNNWDYYFEFVSLLSNANKYGLKGNHLSLIRAEMFKLLKAQLEDNRFLHDKEILIQELLDHKSLMENDLIINFPNDEKDKIHLYELEAYFPLKMKSLHFYVEAKTFYEAAFIIRSNFGEFNLQDKDDLKIVIQDYKKFELNFKRTLEKILS